MSKLEVNTVAPQCGTTLTLGESGDTVTLGTGASQSGFGRTGTVDWVTTVKTGDFTAVSGNGYFVNTTSGEVDVTLPSSPSAGDIVSIKDYAEKFNTNNCILLRNSSKIGGQEVNATLSTQGVAITLVYIDSTQGWLVVNQGLTSDAPTKTYMAATGGTITCCGDYKIHKFTGPGTFEVTSVGNSAGSNTVQYMVVGAGGGGGNSNGGGGGAGGFRMASCFTAPVASYPLTVGGGGAGMIAGTPDACGPATPGNTAVFSSITSAGGGGGGSGAGGTNPGKNGANGGSGGGGGTNAGSAGNGNTPSVSPPQGNNGGGGAGPTSPVAPTQGGGGGGGAACAGTSAVTSVPGGNAGPGGAGSPAAPIFGAAPKAFYLSNSPLTGAVACGVFAGGGGGGAGTTAPITFGAGGVGGGGNGGDNSPTPNCGSGIAGVTNSGGGGGGSKGPSPSPNTTGGTGGSGIILIRYKYQN